MTKADPFRPLSQKERKHSRPEGQEPERWRPITPPPEQAPLPPTEHPRFGKPVVVYEYRNGKGRIDYYRYRFENGSSKDIVPCTYGNLGGREGWHWKAPRPPMQLYNLHKLTGKPTVPVVVVEGEKAADAAVKLFEDAAVVTSPHGAKAARKADWSPLSGRSVSIWPDNDEDGLTYAGDVAQLSLDVGATEVKILRLDTIRRPKP